jgi:non-specific protein-tyrosine kinase
MATRFPEARPVRLPELTLAIHEAGAGPAVVFCHGFPDLARSWKHQVCALADAGYRAIAPDMRGYGGSDAPQAIEDYDVEHLCGDLVGLLDALQIERAVFVGHDWGGFVAWAMPVLHPERCLGVVGVNTPYTAFPATAALRLVFPDPEKLYILWFQQPEVPERVMDPQARTIFERILRAPTEKPEVGSLAEVPDANPFRNAAQLELRGRSVLDPGELEIYLEAYARNGFHGPVSWYRNIDRNRERCPAIGEQKLSLPCLQFTAEWDAALPPASADGMPEKCSDLERHDLLACGHWSPREKDDELSATLLDWLERKIRPLTAS